MTLISRFHHCALVAATFFSGALAQAQQVDLEGLPDYPAQAVTEANWYGSEGNMRWMSRNFSVKPSLVISRGSGVHQLERHPAYDEGLDNSGFAIPGLEGKLTLGTALENANVDAYLVLKDGKLLFERYREGFTEHSHHSWYSGAKSLIGMAMGNLVEDGRLELSKTPADYIPALRKSAYDSITLRQVLNMTAGLAYTEDPEAMLHGHFRYEYLTRAGMLPPYDVYLQTLQPSEENILRGVRGLMPLLAPSETIRPGERFDYQNINVDVAGWLIETASGQRLEHFLSEQVWQKLQTEHDALIPTDPNFTALAAGGISSTARDAARFGLAVLNGGALGKERVFSTEWINDTCRSHQQDEKAFANRERSPGDFSALGSVVAYRNYWYIHSSKDCAMTSRGYGGQSVYVNRARGVVIVTFASSLAENSENRNRLLYLSNALAGEL